VKRADQTKIQTLLRLLTTAAATMSLYQADHRQVLRLNRQALQIANELLSVSSAIVLRLIEGRLIFANQPLESSIAVTRASDALKRAGISHLQIDAGVYAEELLGLVSVLSKNIEKTYEPQRSEHIHYGQIEVRFKSAQQISAETELARIATAEADTVMELYQSIRKGARVNISGINEIVSGFVNAFSTQGDAFLAIAPLRGMDEYTYTHSTNICMLNLAQAKMLGIQGQLLNDIGISAMLHDVGKMFISPEILSKAGQLTEEEWGIMQQHPRLGAEYLIGCPGVPRLAVITAFEHHMRYDNAGYPKPSRSWVQHLSSYMTAISDTYDAMRTHRAYEDSLDLNQIMAIMLDLAGTKLHPQLTYNFLGTISSFDSDG
jgi:HD-GYP domain-containing protein (c-di-GMP phosphodiesterase class II)